MANDARKSKLALRAMSLALGGALLLPAVSAFAATSYTATNNDTFWTLSKKFGVPVQKWMDANPKVNPRNIYSGLKLTIPAKTTAASAAAKPAAAAKVQTLKAEVVSAPAAKTVMTSAGQALTFSKVIDMKASAYSSAANENGGWGAVDYFGNPLKLGTIAVDPKIIPLGSKVFIAGYSFDGLPEGGMVAKATDAGSAIVGNRIDIFIPGTPAKVSTFGFQNVKLYVLN